MYYSKKPVDFLETGEIIPIEEEFISMSRRPGIGKEWIKMHFKSVYPKDFYSLQGKKFKPPRYYDEIFDGVDPKNLEIIKKERRIRAEKTKVTPKRLAQKHKAQQVKLKFLTRGYENGSETIFSV